MTRLNQFINFCPLPVERSHSARNPPGLCALLRPPAGALDVQPRLDRPAAPLERLRREVVAGLSREKKLGSSRPPSTAPPSRCS